MTGPAQLATMSRARPHEGGFTLVELLVAFALFAMISVLLAGGLRFGVRAWEAGRARAEPTEEVGIAQNLLRREIAEAALPRDENDMAHAFTGGPDSIAFSAPLPAAAAAGESYAFQLQAVGSGGRADLALAWRPAAVPADARDASSAILLENIAGIELAYFGAAVSGKAPIWSSRWSGTAGLPELVRVRVIFPAGDRRLWPDLFVAPRYEALQ